MRDVKSGNIHTSNKFDAVLANPFKTAESKDIYFLDPELAERGETGVKVDMETAYELLACADPDTHIAAWYSRRKGRWRYACLAFLSFGNVVSVYTYARVGRLLRTIFNADFIAIVREYIDDFPSFEYDELIHDQVDYMHFFFSLFQNVSFKKTEVGKVINILGLLYDVTNSMKPHISLPHEMRQRIADAAETALSSVARSELVLVELQRALGLANFLVCATHFA